jgi:hypothetical protein
MAQSCATLEGISPGFTTAAAGAAWLRSLQLINVGSAGNEFVQHSEIADHDIVQSFDGANCGLATLSTRAHSAEGSGGLK